MIGRAIVKLECPSCGAQTVKTLPNNVNFKSDGHCFVLRARQCATCKHTWNTIEAPVVLTDSLRAFKYRVQKSRLHDR